MPTFSLMPSSTVTLCLGTPLYPPSKPRFALGPITAMVLILLQIERRNAVFVLEQRDGFMRCRERQIAMLVAADHALRLFGIDVWIVEQSHLELPEQHRRNQFIELAIP